MTLARLVLALPLLFLLAPVAGCAAPLQQGGVEVRPGIAERLGVMCRYGHGSADMCVADDLEEEPQPQK